MSTSCASSCTTVSLGGHLHQESALDRMKAAAAAAAAAKEQERANCHFRTLTEAALLRHEQSIATTTTKAFPAHLFYAAQGAHLPAPVPPLDYSNGCLGVEEEYVAEAAGLILSSR
jgi:hypothetical protein